MRKMMPQTFLLLTTFQLASCDPGLSAKQRDEVTDLAGDSAPDTSELQDKVDTLESKVEEHEQKISDLESKVSDTETRLEEVEGRLGL